jgi:hypothetical protein
LASKKAKAELEAMNVARFSLTTWAGCALSAVAGGAAKARAMAVVHDDGEVCTDLALGLNRPLNGIGSDALRDLLKAQGIPALTYNGRLGEISAVNGLPEWMNRVRAGINDPSVRLYITLDGLEGGTADMSVAQQAVARIQKSVRNGKNLKDKDVASGIVSGTDWELATISRSFFLKGRAPSSVSWYMNGKDISAEVRALLPTTTEEWLVFRGDR